MIQPERFAKWLSQFPELEMRKYLKIWEQYHKALGIHPAEAAVIVMEMIDKHRTAKQVWPPKWLRWENQ
jgi:hypothetical protein